MAYLILTTYKSWKKKYVNRKYITSTHSFSWYIFQRSHGELFLGGTPLKINILHIIPWRFGSDHVPFYINGWFVGEPAINLPGCTDWDDPPRWSPSVTISSPHLGPWQVRQMSAGSFNRRIATEGPVMAALPGAVGNDKGRKSRNCILQYWKSRWHNPYILVHKDPLLTVPFGICAICFDLKVSGWWLNQPHLKNMLVKMGSSSPILGVKIKHIYLSCHHPVVYINKTSIYDLWYA